MSLVAVPAPSSALVDAEFALLANLLYNNRAIDNVADILAPDDFADQSLGLVYAAMVTEHSQGRAANVVSLWPMASELPAFSGPDGKHRWMSAASSASLLSLAPDGARLVAREGAKRRLAAALREAADMASDPSSKVDEIGDIADAALTEAMLPSAKGRSLSASTALARLADDMSKPSRAVYCNRVPSIDKLTRGLRPKQLVILAGRPGMGKTAVALSLSLGTALAGIGTLYISLEMGATELSARMMADLAFDSKRPIAMDEILAENPTQAVIDRTVEFSNRMAEYPLEIEDLSYLTVGRLAMLIRRWKRKMEARGQKLSLVVVDYLQLLSADTKHRSNYEAISEISRALKAIAKENDVTLVALAQLSREVEKRPGKRPQLADLRDSGQIEQDADIVLFLLRDEYYLRKEEPAPNSPDRAAWEQSLNDCENKIEVICAKHRQAQEGVAFGQFYSRFQAVR